MRSLTATLILLFLVTSPAPASTVSKITLLVSDADPQKAKVLNIEKCSFRRAFEYLWGLADIRPKKNQDGNPKNAQEYELYAQPHVKIVVRGCKLLRATRKEFHVDGHRTYFTNYEMIFENYYDVGVFPANIKVAIASPQYLPEDINEHLFNTLGPIEMVGEAYLHLKKGFLGKDGMVHYIELFLKPEKINGRESDYPSAPGGTLRRLFR